MSTDLERFNEAYATMTVAAYEPMIGLATNKFSEDELAPRRGPDPALLLLFSYSKSWRCIECGSLV